VGHPAKEPTVTTLPATLTLRFVKVRGTRYLRLDDVAALVRALGDGEATAVRKRLAAAADSLLEEAKR
jgi:hypothetical protein